MVEIRRTEHFRSWVNGLTDVRAKARIFARIDRMGRDSFDIYWMRHTGKWWRLHTGVTPVEALRLTAVEADTLKRTNLSRWAE